MDHKPWPFFGHQRIGNTTPEPTNKTVSIPIAVSVAVKIFFFVCDLLLRSFLLWYVLVLLLLDGLLHFFSKLFLG